MSSCFSGGGTTYGFDLEIVKFRSTTSSPQTSHTSTSTISDSSNTQSPLSISTRKSRTPRKRPNQTYIEAAQLLSQVYPKIFPTKHSSSKPRKLNQTHECFFDESGSDTLLFPLATIDNPCFLIHQPFQDEHINFGVGSKWSHLCEKPSQNPAGENENRSDLSNSCTGEYSDDFDAESILDEEIVDEGIESIMGNIKVVDDEGEAKYNGPSQIIGSSSSSSSPSSSSSYVANPMGLGFGLKGGVRALKKHVDDVNWWDFPTVNVVEISPKFNSSADRKTTKNKNKERKKAGRVNHSELQNSKEMNSVSNKLQKQMDPIPSPKRKSGLLLKLNYEKVLDVWSDRGLPFPDDGSDVPDNDVSARLAQIDLFPENGLEREVSVLRYKEKRRTRLFSKKIRYEVRKVNADQRPRMKGRFVRRTSTNDDA